MCQEIDFEWVEREYYGLGYRARDKEIVHCEDCANWLPDRKFCVQWHVGTFEDNFCYMAKRSSDGMMQSELGIKTKTIPSADRPQGEWIPCSERMPEETADYLCWVINPYDESLQYHMICTWYAGAKKWSPYDETASSNVVAWMPLPKPWKGADDGD